MNDKQLSWGQSLALYSKRPVLIMLVLGFFAGLPFLLVFSTLTAWLTEHGASRSAIGFFGWVGITYSVKVFWAPVVDNLPLPLLNRLLGKRRSWLLIAQAGIAAGLLLMATLEPKTELIAVALCAVFVAFSSATQDIVIDAYRIEVAVPEYQAAMAATYNLGYRIALLVAGAGSLYIADLANWPAAYTSMAGIMALGILFTFFIGEPAVKGSSQEATPVFTREWFVHAVVSPFVDFFKRNGTFALLILAFIGLFRLSDITMGIMANPFYLDLGFSKSQIASISKLYGFAMTIVGGFLGGICVARFGVHRVLIAGAIMVALTNLFFVQLALVGAVPEWLIVTISADNLSAGFAATSFIAYLSGLTNRAYTATQYALFSSLMTLPGKFQSGFSGVIVDNFGYASFFLYAAAMGIPAIVLAVLVWRTQEKAS
ncbi:MFS transporter, PAT family, beta-lactamase induction signal transducer AmpG [Alteromonadaceae bacterium Bs31]|nr:MFS transporter, PAT family, beta-lactamase induction signal transducer AmpG [Alteromonadaceae bacterium Bs31]